MADRVNAADATGAIKTTREHDIDVRKRVLRAQAREARATSDPVTRAANARRWTAQVLRVADVGPGTVVAAYLSYGTEPPTAHLIAELTGLGADVLLPVLLEDRDLDWVSDGGELMGGQSVGAQSAVAASSDFVGARLGPDAIARADLVVAPALLVSLDGTRLGQGGGSYDRALSRLRSGTPVVALVHDDEVLDPGALPHDLHDLPATHAAAPGGLAVLAGRDRSGNRGIFG